MPATAELGHTGVKGPSSIVSQKGKQLETGLEPEAGPKARHSAMGHGNGKWSFNQLRICKIIFTVDFSTAPIILNLLLQ